MTDTTHAIAPARDDRITVVGLGYVGLPAAVALAESGAQVVGIDISAARVAAVADGRSPVEDVADERIAAVLAGLGNGGRLSVAVVAEADDAVAESGVAMVCVPTPSGARNEPDLSAVLAAAGYLGARLQRGALAVLVSTVYPGTTTGPFRRAMEAASPYGEGAFDIAFAPERINPGDPSSAGRGVPRLVGGDSASATGRASAMLARITGTVVPLSSPEAAETAKLLENTFRAVNIALANELALVCEPLGLDVWEIADAAATKPFGFMRFTPGPGVGGHCIAVDPHYLAWSGRAAGAPMPLVEAAMARNEGMPAHVAGLVRGLLADDGIALRGARIGAVGASFKPGVADARNSPAIAVMTALAAGGAEVRFADPHVASARSDTGERLEPMAMDEMAAWADVLVVLVAHPDTDWPAVMAADRIVDAVGATRRRPARAGQRVIRLGDGTTG
jgi:UDP-N-acetyl-D-glucosamine dehydrogenase